MLSELPKSMLFLFCLSYFYEIIRMIKNAQKTRPVRYDTHFIKLNGVCSFQTCDWFSKMNCVLNYAIANIFSAFSALICLCQDNKNILPCKEYAFFRHWYTPILQTIYEVTSSLCIEWFYIAQVFVRYYGFVC